MQCNQFERILEEQVEDGRWPKPALEHIEVCENCRALTADLDAIHGIALELGAEGIAPPEHLWVSLRNQLEAEGVIREPNHSQPSRQPVRNSWWSAFQKPAFAGAFLSVVVFAAALVTYEGGVSQMAAHPQFAPQQQSPVFSADSIFKEEMRTVTNDPISGMQLRDTTVRDSFRRNLSVVDKFIALCEKSVREQPENEMAREYLYGAYEQKAELLATATNRSMAGGLQ
jgi:hypothetical protein